MSERVLRSASQRQLTEAAIAGTKRTQEPDDFLEGLPPAKAIADDTSSTSESAESPSSTKSVVPLYLFEDDSDSELYSSPQKTAVEADVAAAIVITGDCVKNSNMDQQVVTSMRELKLMFQETLDETLDRKLLGFLEPKMA